MIFEIKITEEDLVKDLNIYKKKREPLSSLY